MRRSLGSILWLVLIAGSCAQPSDVSEVRSYAEAVESYAADLEQRMDRRLDDLEARMDDTEIYAQEACARLNC